MNKPIIDNSITSPRSRINTSCNWTGTTDFGRLVPFHIEELVPTDKVITCRPKIEMSMLPLASPTFGKLDLYVHYFFVPTRLIWEAADQYFAGQGTLKNDTPPYFTPYALSTFYNSLNAGAKRAMFKHWTSMGLPPFFTLSEYAQNTTRNKDMLTILKFRAYQQIWWDFYRDPEVLRDESKENYINTRSGEWSTSGTGSAANQNLVAPKVRTIKDCWISNLFAESGSSPINLPVGFYAHVPEIESIADISDTDIEVRSGTSGNSSRDFRQIEALTRLSERLSLGGKRAIDAMFAAYGVKPNFMKMQMAQYVGGSKSTVLVSDITSSADTIIGQDGGTPLGAKAGSGYCAMSDLNIDFTASERGYLVGIFSVMPHVHFNQGFNKSWYRNTRYDWFTKELERTGQVAVSKKEVGVLSYNSPSYNRSYDSQTFAFTQPYYEYKMGQDILAGDFATYHSLDPSSYQSENQKKAVQYMQSMEMYIDYPLDRMFNADNLKIDGSKFQKIFYYLGGSLWDDVDDHFHLCIDKEVVKDSPMDGYAVPTIETTEDPHASKAPVGRDKVL